MTFDEVKECNVTTIIATRDTIRRELCKYYSWMFAGAPHGGGSEVRDKVAELELQLIACLTRKVEDHVEAVQAKGIVRDAPLCSW